MLKNEVRKLNRTLRDGMKDIHVHEYSKMIAQRIINSDIYHNADIILSYLSFRNEPDTSDIISDALGCGKKVAAPVVTGRSMEFFFIEPNEDYSVGAYGIKEPRNNKEDNRYEPKAGDRVLMLVPGLGFDRFGNRVGYGAGYYDRYLTEHPEAGLLTVGLCYDFMLVEQIDADEYDIRVQNIATERRLIRI